MEKRLPNTCGLQLFRVIVKKSHILCGRLSAKKQKCIFLDIDGSTERFDPFFHRENSNFCQFGQEI